MTITQLVDMAEHIHDVEGYNLGASSSRDYRNAFWARVIGCAYWGHPVYNPTPDRQWHLKKADEGRPQTDDVATSIPSRDHWDCIPGAGANGYSFSATSHGPLPASQLVYPPPMPDQSGVEEPEPEPPHVCPPCPPVPPTFPYPDENTHGKSFQQRVKQAYTDAHRPFPDPNDQDAFRHFMRYGYSCHEMPEPDAANKHIAELRAQLGV